MITTISIQFAIIAILLYRLWMKSKRITLLRELLTHQGRELTLERHQHRALQLKHGDIPAPTYLRTRKETL